MTNDEIERRREAFAVALSEGKAMGPSLDPEIANSPRADELRAAGIEEDLLAKEIRRGIESCKPGIDHIRYLKLISEWLGYKESPVAGERGNGASTLAGAVAGALAGAREAGLMREKVRDSREPLGGDAIRIIDAERA